MRLRNEFPRIRPGDIGFDEGVGWSSKLIRIASKSAYGHCFIYHSLVEIDANGEEVWQTVESGPKDGVIFRTRVRRPNKVVRIWRDELEQSKILKKSEEMIGLQYGWGEIIRISLWLIGIKVDRMDNPKRVICSNHVTCVAIAGRPDFWFYLRFKPNDIWPGELAVTLDAYIWDIEQP